ncbi:serine/threonine-protein kinase [Streptomyces sp. YIM S03343]
MSEVGEHEPDPDGRLIDGRYQLLERVGGTGSGTVWRALDQVEGQEVAVKQPRLVGESGSCGEPEGEERQRAVNRLCHEARVAARVDHPSAIVIHDVVVEDGLPWVVMEYVRGESLDARLRRGTVSHDEAARIGVAVLGALRAAHAAGMVHRDLKPANVLLGEDGRVLLTDFGIAHVNGTGNGNSEDSGSGDGEFVAPEQLSGPGAGPASDLWALGALLYAAVEGAAPERGAVQDGTSLVDEPGGPLGELVVRMLAREPEERPGAAEVAVVLDAVAEGRDVPEIPVPVPVPVPGSGLVPGPAPLVDIPAQVDGREEAPPGSFSDTSDTSDTSDASEASDGSDGSDALAALEADAHPRNSPLRRLLTGLGLALPPAPEPGEDPDRQPTVRAIR